MNRWWLVPFALTLALAPQLGNPEAPLQFIKVAEVQWLALQGRQVLLVDVRTTEEYRARHIKGALSMPLGALETRYREVPRQGLVILY